MKRTNKLQVGDWIVTSREIKSGKFSFGKVTGFRFKEFFNMDLEKCELKKINDGSMDGEGYALVLNKKELDNLLKVKLKLGMIEELK